MEDDSIKELLSEIRDLQREHLAAYREHVNHQISLQEGAVARQKKQVRVYYISLVLLAGLIAYFVYRFV